MERSVEGLLDKEGVAGTVTTLFVATDQADWPAVRGCFAPSVRFDMSSVTGEGATVVAAEEIVSGWETGLRHLEAVHHQIGNLQIEVKDEEATATCHGIAFHYLPNPSGEDTRLFVGSYDLHLVKIEDAWAIDGFRFNLKFMGGNPSLEGVE